MFEDHVRKEPLLRGIFGDMTGEFVGEGSELGELIFGPMTRQARYIHRHRARGEGPVSGAQVLSALPTLPGGNELLSLAAEREDVELVGGAVRDLLLGLTPRELDVVVAADAAAFARELAARLDLPAATVEHERFGTARVKWEGGRIDIATRRAESYPTPGALPDVRPGTPEEDLRRRDFTVNAIAVPLAETGIRAKGACHPASVEMGIDQGDTRYRNRETLADARIPGSASAEGACHPASVGADRADGAEVGLRAVDHALADLAAGRLRVLHERSFLEDPTRLLRLARYYARLGFAIERHTGELAVEAVAAHALDTVSGARLGAELRLMLAEPAVLYALMVLHVLEVLPALHPWLHSEATLERTALSLLPIECRPDLLLLASLLLVGALRTEDDPRAELVAFLDRLEFPAEDRDRVVATVMAVPRLVEALPAAESPSALRDAVRGAPLEAIALAGALEDMTLLGATEDAFWAAVKDGINPHSQEQPVHRAARRWLEELRHMRLRITGDDLLAAGVPEGPEIGRRLEETLRMRLDGELPDEREPQLQAALRPRQTDGAGPGPVE